ncbi:MAG TPA: endonuclease V [Haliscomenobacter sp.]|uniref:endonuclease V n=1 Tax=Haliscomenobacter sp. TaxID=2717303 RepID=UPI002B82AA6A|nr:endonuclease V [Haliscomenobacter sp.]HOY16112.1 endonuclease V [Haliscomenobacter sp.]HPH21193.1 endonuclease V [Haliscomenobacter sp.]
MLICLDTDYRDPLAQCAYALFDSWAATESVQVSCVRVEQVAPYEPGAFYKRELPGLLQALASVDMPLEAILIDAYVWLDEGRGGLGWYLYEALEQKIPVVGIAKTRFRPAEKVAISVLRGESKNPLWVTAIGMEADFAAEKVQEMAGEFRIPEMLKLVDGRCREWVV